MRTVLPHDLLLSMSLVSLGFSNVLGHFTFFAPETTTLASECVCGGSVSQAAVNSIPQSNPVLARVARPLKNAAVVNRNRL